MPDSTAIVTFSHLRWNFVYQRPQHLMSRFAKHRDVYFVEEPIATDGDEALEIVEPCQNLTVLRPKLHMVHPGFHLENLKTIRSLLVQYFRRIQLQYAVEWFYTPLALPLSDVLHPSVIVYDCMDELAKFLGAPAGLADREAELFERASLVFTGGRSLYEAKRELHSNIYCFPSSVDAQHFRGSVELSPEPEDQQQIARPRFGYFGVLDERIDFSLIATMAARHPEWQMILIGPVAKIDCDSLPQASNIHYLGQKTYQDLSHYLQGWDICLLPFAMNDATRFISPTKTLEYMAGEKLIVSTPIADVARPFRNIVYFGKSTDAWISACELALQDHEHQTPQAQRRIEAGRSVLESTSWDRTADEMDRLISATAKKKATANIFETEVAIIGAGPTGLSAAYHLGENTTLIEQNDRVGGWCRSIEDNGFTFDYAGHIMFSADSYVHQLYKMLLGDNLHWQDREAWIYSKNVYTRYPFQGSLYGLPPQIIKECIVGAIEARFGCLKDSDSKTKSGQADGGTSTHSNGKALSCLLAGASGGDAKDDPINDCCADGILESSVPSSSQTLKHSQHPEPFNFEEFIYKVWGRGIAKHFAIPYNQKLWAVPLQEMETSWLGGRVPLPDLEEIVDGALKPSPKPMGPNARFGYPLRGGFQALMDGFLPYLKCNLLLQRRVEQIDAAKKVVILSDGSRHRYEYLVSTMPLPELIRAMGDQVPSRIIEFSRRLRHVSVRCVNLGIGRSALTDKHWIYYPEDTVFHRIFLQGSASPHCNAPGGFGITCEITYSVHKPLPAEGQDLINLCIADCRKVGIIRDDDPIWSTTQSDLPYAYVVYDFARAEAVSAIRGWLESKSIFLAGRYSEWEYYNSDHAFLAGKKVADLISRLRTKPAQSEVPVPPLYIVQAAKEGTHATAIKKWTTGFLAR
jgi:UDP-galactopyranose mutase